MSRSNLSLLFPGCEALDDDINVDINTTGTPADAAEAATEAEDLATEGADTQAEAEETSTAAEAFAHQFSELCALHKHISRYGVDRTMLALCNRNNILGRALNLRLPATESFDNVGSPYSATSVACLEALSEGLWQKFKDFIARIVKAIRNFGLKMTQWWRDLSGNYETRLQQFDEFFKASRVFKKKEDLDGYKGFYMSKSEINDINNEFEQILNGGASAGSDEAAATNLINKANAVINAVLKAGSSSLATTGANSAIGADNESDNIKTLADELGEKAQEDRDKILDKLEEARDKVNEKLDDKTNDAKEKEPDDILKDIAKDTSINATYEQDSTKVATSLIIDAKKYITQIRQDEEAKSMSSPALKTALDRLERNAIMKNGAGMSLDARDAITRSVSVAQQILTKRGSLSTYKAKLLNICFKNISTIKAMSK